MPGYRTFPIIVSVIATLPQVAGTQQPRLTIEPKDPSGGSLVRVTIDGLTRNDSAAGEMAGEPLRFVPAGNGRLQALGAIPVEASDSLLAKAIVARASGERDSLHLWITVPHEPPPVAGRGPRLAVDQRFTQPLDTKTEERVARENQLARDVGKRAQTTPPLWTYPFLRPRE